MTSRVPAAILLLTTIFGTGSRAQQATPFAIDEATIAGVHAAMREGRLTCRGLVEQYLRRIAAYDKTGPAINAIIITNPRALDEADDLDRRFKQSGPTGPLHCVPMIVKDNFETIGLQSANGSLALEGFVSPKDAFQVKRVKEAGALVLAKSNMAEWAFTPYETVSSILPGYTKNPYALDRVTAGSSGGTAASVAANFGLIGLGSDTGNSIRGPSSHQALVGLRSTMGLTSRAGVMPLNLQADIAGPIGRTVTDVAAVFQAIVGEDPDDPATAAARGRPRENYAQALQRDGLKGARIGVLRQAYERSTAGPQPAGGSAPRDTTDPEVASVFMKAVADLQAAGAIIVDPATIEGLDAIRRPQGTGPCMGFKYDINRYFASHGDRIPMKSLTEVVASGRFHPSVRRQSGADRAGAGEWSGDARLSGGNGVSRTGPRRGPEDDGCLEAGRVRVSDVEQPAATDRRSQLAARRQQPVLLADHGIPGDTGADGLHARWSAARGHHVLRPRVGRGDADQAGVRLRAGDPPPACAGQRAAAPVSAARRPGS